MCNFASWIEKNGKSKQTLYLTRKLIESAKGKELLGKLTPEDLCGHGAIRLFFGLEQDEGVNKECSDFSDPSNFPAVIASAIKQGKMVCFPFPSGLLRKPLDDKYQADRKPLYDKYWADRKCLYDKYQADQKCLYDKYQAGRKPLDDKYQADRKPLDDKYWAGRKCLYDKHQADRKCLYDKYWADQKCLSDKYQADRKPLYDKYWALFADPANRAGAWR